MSQITNVVTTIFRARRDGSVAAEMGGINQGMGRFQNQLMQATRMSERFSAQWRAIGTTFRYAVAGGLVFGAARLVTNLRDLQRQVGLIQALGNAQNGILPNTRLPVVGLLRQARDEAVAAVTPLNEFNEGLINLFSSVQNVPENKAARMMREISLAAQLAQTDSQTASKAVFGMLQTFGMAANVPNIQKFTRSLSTLITQVPGGPEAGRQIMQQYPQLAASYLQGRGTPAQMFANYQTILRAGGSPSTGGRGLQYLIQTLANPAAQTAESRRMLGTLGINQQFISQHGVEEALARLIAHVRSLGVGATGAARTAPDDVLSEMFGDAMPSIQQMGNIGLTGRGSEFLSRAIPRIHGVRAAVLLATQNDVHSGNLQMVTDLKQQEDSFNGTADAIRNYNQQTKNLTDPQQLQKAAIALSGINQQAVQAIQPGLNLGARGVQAVAHQANRHSDATRIAMLAALGVGAFVGGRRFLSGGGRAVVTANAVKDAMSGGVASGDSPQNPLYVVVVGQLFGGGTRGPGGITGAGGGDLADDAVKGWAGWKALRFLGRGAGRITRAGERGVVRAGMRAGILGAEASPTALRVGGRILGPLGVAIGELANPDVAGGSSGEMQYQRRIELLRRQFGQGVRGFELAGNMGRVQGRADVYMTIDIQHPGGKVERRRVHVPADMWTLGKRPTSRGKATTRK